METERLCSQETFLPPTAMLGEMYLFHFHTLLCLIWSRTKRKSCYSLGVGEVLFLLQSVTGNFIYLFILKNSNIYSF